MHWIEFFLSSAVIVIAGIRLTIDADRLCDDFQLGKVWIGVVLLGLVTSLPEAITSLVSIISLESYDLAIGNLMGSNNFNPMLIVVMDIFYRQGSVTNAVEPEASHIVSSRYAMLLIFFVVMEIGFSAMGVSIHVGPMTLAGTFILIFYCLGMSRLARLGQGGTVIAQSREWGQGQGNGSIVKICLRLLFSSVLVILAATRLASSADSIAQSTGLGGTFVGSIFLALVTSLPEMVVSLSALKLGSFGLAVGNIFGSNMTNMFILFICSLFYRGGTIFEAVSRTHMATGVLSIILCFIAIKGICTKNKKTIFGLGWDSILMLFLFVVGTYCLYQIRGV